MHSTGLRNLYSNGNPRGPLIGVGWVNHDAADMLEAGTYVAFPFGQTHCARLESEMVTERRLQNFLGYCSLASHSGLNAAGDDYVDCAVGRSMLD